MDKKQDSAKRPDGRTAYTPPKLKTLGPVGALTQAGSGMNTETMTMWMFPMDGSMQQRP